MTIKCSPHHWTTPKPGDTDLICPDCGRALSILYIDEYKVPAILWAIGNRPADLNAFRGFLNRGPRAEEFHPEGIERSRSLARERERISDPNKAKKYRCLKEKYHKPGFYSGWKDDNETYLPIVWRPDGKVLPLGPSLAFYSLSPFFDWGYDGDAPSQLALAILYDHTKDKRQSFKHYEDFMRDKVARLPNTEWGLFPPEDWLKYREMR